MARTSFEVLPECGETLVIKNLLFTCQLARAHVGVHSCRAEDDQGTQLEWPVAWQARATLETNAEKDASRQFNFGSTPPVDDLFGDARVSPETVCGAQFPVHDPRLGMPKTGESFQQLCPSVAKR
jgi:hypothetical protein